VSTDATVIRAGQYSEIGTIIQLDCTILIDRWARRAAKEQPTAKRVHHSILLDELPAFLVEVGTSLQESDDGNASAHGRLAHEHAEQRWQTGWSLTELIRDYRILRLVVIEHLYEKLARPLRLAELQAVGLALDEAIECAVERYVQQRERELKRLEDDARSHAEVLLQADRRKNEFLATLAHELRNPLSALRNSLEVVRLSPDSVATIHRFRELMDRQVSQMNRLIEDLLDVARIAQNKLALHKESIQLQNAIEEAVQVSMPLMKTRKHRLTLNLATNPLSLIADHTRIIQVFVNVLDNASKYTPEGGEITITAESEGSEAVVRFKDNGLGIAPELLPYVFDLFTQANHASDRPQSGLGIGLTLVKRLVELQGGTIIATSPGLGHGSEFTIRLPLAVTNAEPRDKTPG